MECLYSVAIFKNYHSFGMPMPERSLSLSDYRFGFNGKEKDDDVKGGGNSLDFGARIYDPRLGRWLTCDPLFAKYPFASAYIFSIDNPINAIDPNGKDVVFVNGFSEHDKEKNIDVKINGVMLSVHQPDNIETKGIADKAIQFTYGNDNSSLVQPMGKVPGVTDANPENKNNDKGGLDAHAATVDKDDAFNAIKAVDAKKKIFTKKK